MPKSVFLSALCLFVLVTSSITSASYFWSSSEPQVSESLSEPKTAKKIPTVFTGTVEYSFVSSVLDTGVTPTEVKSLLDLTTDHFNVLNQASKGGQFAFKTDMDKKKERFVRAFYYKNSDKEFYAYRGNDNQIYDQDGFQFNSLSRLQMPFKRHYRISSSFSLNRRHPVTNRITPHYGTDYATPVGTPVLAVAPGKVLVSRHDHYAGNYITIKHGNGVLSRYMHLKKSKVKRGDYVAAGDIIALSGNTGRTTGPHLHVELIEKGIPIDYAKTMRDFNRRESWANRSRSMQAVNMFHTLKGDLNQQTIALATP